MEIFYSASVFISASLAHSQGYGCTVASEGDRAGRARDLIPLTHPSLTLYSFDPTPLPDAPYLVSLDVSILVVQWGRLPGHIQLCGRGTVDGHVLRCCRGHWRARRLESECSWV